MKRSLACLAGVLSGTMAMAVPVFDMSPSSQYSYSWNDPLMLGYSFRVSNSPLTFNALAVFDVQSATVLGGASNSVGLSKSHRVGVWDSSGNLVVSATVMPGAATMASSNNGAGEWVYQSVASTTLAIGEYTVAASYSGSTDADTVMVNQTIVNNFSNATYLADRYSYTSSFLIPVQNHIPLEQAYFGPAMLQVPEPGSFALMGFGLTGLACIRRRKNALTAT